MLRPYDVTTTWNLLFVHSFMQFQLKWVHDVISHSKWSEFFFNRVIKFLVTRLLTSLSKMTSWLWNWLLFILIQRDKVKWMFVTPIDGYLRAPNGGFIEKTIFLFSLFLLFFETADLRSYCGYFLAICQLCSYVLVTTAKIMFQIYFILIVEIGSRYLYFFEQKTGNLLFWKVSIALFNVFCFSSRLSSYCWLFFQPIESISLMKTLWQWHFFGQFWTIIMFCGETQDRQIANSSKTIGHWTFFIFWCQMKMKAGYFAKFCFLTFWWGPSSHLH